MKYIGYFQWNAQKIQIIQNMIIAFKELANKICSLLSGKL